MMDDGDLAPIMVDDWRGETPQQQCYTIIIHNIKIIIIIILSHHIIVQNIIIYYNTHTVYLLL